MALPLPERNVIIIMKFTVSTKPLKTAVGLAVVDKNVNKYYQRSILIQLSADKTDLTINTESNSIFSEVNLKGTGDGEPAVVLLDSLLFKQLISTINTPQVTIDFTDNGITIIAGKSTYSLPKLMDSDEIKLESPDTVDNLDEATDIDKNGWKFIKEHQLFAKATSTTNPVYTYVWTGDSDVLVGDYVNSLFTHSESGQLEKPCLLSESIINLLVSMPDDAKIIAKDDTYVISVKSDSYEYTSQFKPLYESDDNGNYNAEMILSLMPSDDDKGIIINGDEIISALNQSLLLADTKIHNIQFSVDSEGVRIKDNRVDCFIAPDNKVDTDAYTLTFNPNVLKSVISACPESIVKICPTVADDEVVGIAVVDKSMTVVLGGLEE